MLDADEVALLRGTLNLSQRRAAAALSLRAPDVWQPILENIIMIGLPEVTQLVLAGRWNKKQREQLPTQGADEI